MARSMKKTIQKTLFLISLLTGVGCGGEVRFVSPHKEADQPKLVVADQSITETFRYGQPTGITILVFMIYPRKSMRDVKDKVYDSISSLMSAFWARASSYDDVRFVIARDADGSTPTWYIPKDSQIPQAQWQDSSTLFLRQSLSQFPIEKTLGEQESRSPFNSMNDLVHSLSSTEAGTHQPLWVHFLYFRDWDLPVDSSTETYVEESKKNFLLSLKQTPLSPFRYSIQLFSHSDGSLNYLPSNRLSINLQRFFSDMSFSQIELNAILDPSSKSGKPWTVSVSDTITHQDAHMVLMKVPDLTTLQVNAGALVIPREETRFNQETNELQLTEQSAQQLQLGDEIQVRYVPKE